jgi:flagellar biosynthetic protein FlhB
MADDSFQEKTERATPHRRGKVREEGRVAKSVELNSAMMILIGFSMFLAIGPSMAGQLRALMGHTMANAPSIAISDPTFVKAFGDTMLKFFAILGPLFAILLVIGVISNVAQVGFKITPKAIQPKLEKLDIVKGFKQKLSLRTLVTMIRDTIKLFIVGFVAYKVVRSEFDGFFLLPDMSAVQLGATMGQVAVWVALKIGAAVLILAILDYAYQKYEFEKSIKMSRQEMKDEFKNTDGNPQIKARVRQIQRETARRRMMAGVPDADVVLTNPTHLAVALKYDREVMDAPFVVAKGERLVAERIKEIAREHGVPVIEDKPLARALFKICEIGEIVPDTLYRAVAEVLAYVYRVKGKVVN